MNIIRFIKNRYILNLTKEEISILHYSLDMYHYKILENISSTSNSDNQEYYLEQLKIIRNSLDEKVNKIYFKALTRRK